MSYYSPYINPAGLHIPTYQEILDDLVTEMKNIFGDDIYLEEDSQDYQQLSIFARKIYDTNNLAALVYNNRTPITAIGTGLDNLCALVGITRKPATASTVQLTITGDPGTVITDGKATDGTYNWSFEEVEIPSNGTITVNATCDTTGNITALPNTIVKIATPTFGWLGVTNNQAAEAGIDVESDEELRGRYAVATYGSALSIFDGITAAVSDLNGVSKLAAYENDTGDVNSLGHPAHSITYVVQGGDTEVIADTIYRKKTPGCYTNGDVITDIVTDSGTTIPIRFYRPTQKNMYVRISITPLASWSSGYIEQIKEQVANYINSLGIGESVYRSAVTSIAMSVMENFQAPAFSVTAVQTSSNGSSWSNADYTIGWKEVAAITSEHVILQGV